MLSKGSEKEIVDTAKRPKIKNKGVKDYGIFFAESFVTGV